MVKLLRAERHVGSCERGLVHGRVVPGDHLTAADIVPQAPVDAGRKLPVGGHVRSPVTVYITPMRPTDVRVRDVSYAFQDFRYRTPIKFGGVALDRVTLLDVTMTVETRAGKTATGF